MPEKKIEAIKKINNTIRIVNACKWDIPRCWINMATELGQINETDIPDSLLEDWKPIMNIISKKGNLYSSVLEYGNQFYIPVHSSELRELLKLNSQLSDLSFGIEKTIRQGNVPNNK